MKPQDVVALILSIGVMFLLLSGTNFKYIWMTPEEVLAVSENYTDQVAAFWKDIVNVILGGLIGYIARGKENGPGA